MKEKHINRKTLRDIKVDEINHLELRSDLELHNILNTFLVAEGYVENILSDEETMYQDDTWAIDCKMDDGFVVESYLYSSQLEYMEDLETLKII